MAAKKFWNIVCILLSIGIDLNCMGVLTWLQLHPTDTVLLTMFDEHIPEEYQSCKIQSNFEYAVALLLTSGRNPEIFDHPPSGLPQALTFLARLIAP